MLIAIKKLFYWATNTQTSRPCSNASDYFHAFLSKLQLLHSHSGHYACFVMRPPRDLPFSCLSRWCASVCTASSLRIIAWHLDVAGSSRWWCYGHAGMASFGDSAAGASRTDDVDGARAVQVRLSPGTNLSYTGRQRPDILTKATKWYSLDNYWVATIAFGVWTCCMYIAYMLASSYRRL